MPYGINQTSQGAREGLAHLKNLLSRLGSVAVAYSGGVDSTFLLAVAQETLGDKVLAITTTAPMVAQGDLARTQDFCREHGIVQEIASFDALALPAFVHNQPDRCYHCKKALFTQMREVADARGFAHLVDGSNKDDEEDYRPGLRALDELGISSPLRLAGMTKAQIRELSHAMGLPTWDLPSAACLASRFAYGETITAAKLRRVEEAESYLRDLGFAQLRVRVHGEEGELARIEVEEDQLERVVSPEVRGRLTEKLKDLGFTFVSLDLVGFRSGAMNEVLTT